MAKVKYPYYVPTICWNGRMYKLSSYRYDTVDDAIKYVQYRYMDKFVQQELDKTDQLFILKYYLNEDEYSETSWNQGHSKVARIYDKNMNLLYNIE